MSMVLYSHNRGGDRSLIRSTCLSERHVQSIIGSVTEAQEIGLPFNSFITIHWERAGLSDSQAAKATGRLIKYASDWMRSKGGWLPWCWVRENDYGDGSKGSHVHILLHCPPGLSLARQFRRWLKLVTGRPYLNCVIKTKRVGGSLACYRQSPALYEEKLRTIVGYILKGALPETLARHGIARTHEPNGFITGKRAARWQRKSNANKSMPVER